MGHLVIAPRALLRRHLDYTHVIVLPDRLKLRLLARKIHHLVLPAPLREVLSSTLNCVALGVHRDYDECNLAGALAELVVYLGELVRDERARVSATGVQEREHHGLAPQV